MAFTLFMGYIHCSSEMSKWKKDKDKNGRTVTVVSSVGTAQMKRGDLRPGHIIRVGANEELPADILITEISHGSDERRVHWAMNEVQVTGIIDYSA